MFLGSCFLLGDIPKAPFTPACDMRMHRLDRDRVFQMQYLLPTKAYTAMGIDLAVVSSSYEQAGISYIDDRIIRQEFIRVYG